MREPYRSLILTSFKAAVLLGAVSTACTSSADQEGPAGPEPQLSGTLEATVTVGGTRPDPDGYTAVVTLAGQSAPRVARFDSTGGVVRFPDLPPGTHSVLLEDLAPNCLVIGANPRLFTINAGVSSKIEFRVACPGPGVLRVQTVTQGVDLDVDSYALVVEASSVLEERIGTNDSILIREEDLSPGDGWTVRLSEVPDHCLLYHAVAPLEALVSSDPLRVRSMGDDTVRVTFTADCRQRSSMIVFENASGASALGDIFVMSESGPVNLTRNPEEDISPSLSPDRSRIVFSSNRDFPWWFASDLYKMDADGNRVIRLTSSGINWVGSQAWSPDGSRIVFTSYRDDSNGDEVYVMNADGSEVVRLTHSAASDRSPAWSPDGRWIAFCSDRESTDGSLDIYRMNASDGSEIVKVVSDGCDPAWSPDGSKIAYTTGLRELPLPDLAVIGIDGAGFVRLDPGNTSFNGVVSGPSWSPDGTSIAFTRSSERNEVMIVGFDENGFGEPMKLTDGASPSWR